jgi:predicted Zn-dependent peptidase
LYQKTTLDNGLRLLTADMPHSRSVAISFFIGTGSRYESAKQAGISHFIEHMCFKGTDRRPTAAAVCSEIEGVGGFLNGGTDKELTIYWCKVALPHFAQAFDVLTDMLLNSRFEPSEIERERQVIIEEINMTLDSPSQRASMLIDELIWPGHALGRDIAGTKESVAAISPDMMRSYMAAQYSPRNTVLSIAGNIDHGSTLEMVKRATAGWAGRGQQTAYVPFREKVGRRVSVECRDTEQCHMCLAMPGIGLNDPRRFQVDLLNVVLGEGMSSRLFAEIRDKLGLAYSIESYSEHFLDTGAVVISAGVETKKLSLAIKAILDELKRLSERIPEAELKKAKELFKGRTLLRLEDSRSVSGWIGGQELLTRRILDVDELIGIIDSINAGELQSLAEELLVSDQLCLSVVGPVSAEEPLEELLKL